MSKRQILIVAHADADGHVIAEQARRNLSRVSSFDVTVVVDPGRTKDHKTWLKLDAITEANGKDIIFFLDLMFAPSAFVAEAAALVEFAEARPDTQIFVLDHHPLPLGRLAKAENVHPVYREDVLECTIGLRTRMMVAAALNEDQPTQAHDFKEPIDDDIAEGLRRAAALGGPLAGKKLSALLRANCWGGLAELGREDKRLHYLPRGLRRKDDDQSSAIRMLNDAAETILKYGAEGASTSQVEMLTMSYDYNYDDNHSPPAYVSTIKTADSRDLETIVSLLEMAAISLTTISKQTFTREELVGEAHKYGGEEIDLKDKDVDLVIGKAGFLRKEGKNLRLR